MSNEQWVTTDSTHCSALIAIMKKTIIILFIAAALVSLAFLGYRYYVKKKNPAEIKTSEVRRGDISVVVEATGFVEPKFKVEVKSKASGEVMHFPFEEGDRIEKGELFLKVDKSDEERNVEREEANILTLKAKLKQAKASLDLQKIEYETAKSNEKANLDSATVSLEDAEMKMKRKKELFDEKLIAREGIDEAQTAYTIAKARLDQAKAQMESLKGMEQNTKIKEGEIELVEGEIKKAEVSLRQARERLKDTEVIAPISGIIIEKRVEKGQIISSGISTVTGGTHLATIADMSSIYIIAEVDETDIGKIKSYQEVNLTTDTYPDRIFYGKVERIAPMGVEQNRIIIFKVKIEVTGEGRELLKPSMTANVQIMIETRKGVLQVPEEAIKSEGVDYSVYVLKNGNQEKRKIKKGISNGSFTEVLEGVKEGEKVVVGGQPASKDRTVVRSPARAMRI